MRWLWGRRFILRWRTTFRQKIETKQDLPKETLQESFTELPVEGTIAGALVQCIVDLLDVEECMIDCKTATRRPCGITPEYGAQLRTYSMITPGATGVCRLDTVTKTKAVQLVQQSCEIGPEEPRYCGPAGR